MKIDIIYKTDDWIAVNKPACLSVHNEKDSDLVSFIQVQFDKSEVYAVNRLDGTTSGLMLIAFTRQAASNLGKLFQDREIKKTYIAYAQVIKGLTPSVGTQGVWNWRLTKRAEGRKDAQGFWKKRVPCETEWEVLDVHENQLKLKLNPRTGRKHQLRRHACIAGWPLKGDIRYGPLNGGVYQDRRVGLHSWKLEFDDPNGSGQIELIAPDPSMPNYVMPPQDISEET
jgi:23S rRNA-/tRNA-specific pseudouridylate synthase